MNRLRIILWETLIVVLLFFIVFCFSASAQTQDKPAPKPFSLYMSTYDTEDPVEVGKNTTYVLEIQNNGSSPINNISVAYQISDQIKFVSVKVPKGLKNKLKDKGKMVEFSPYPILKPGEKITYRINCNVLDEGTFSVVEATGKAIVTCDQSQKQFLDEERTSCFR